MSSPNQGMSSPNKGTPAERGRSQQRTGAQRRPESPDFELFRVEPLSEDSEPDTPAGHDKTARGPEEPAREFEAEPSSVGRGARPKYEALARSRESLVWCGGDRRGYKHASGIPFSPAGGTQPYGGTCNPRGHRSGAWGPRPQSLRDAGSCNAATWRIWRIDLQGSDY